MAHTIPDIGKDWFAERAVTGGYDEFVDIIAVGIGDASIRSSDEQLDDEEYRASKNSSNISIDTTSNPGEIRCTISVTGANEVDANSEIWEFGLFSSDGILLYREVRENPVTVESGDTKTFEFKLTVTE